MYSMEMPQYLQALGIVSRHLSLRLQQGLASHEMKSSYPMDKAHLIHRSCKRIWIQYVCLRQKPLLTLSTLLGIHKPWTWEQLEALLVYIYYYWLDFQTWGTLWCLIRAVVRNTPTGTQFDIRSVVRSFPLPGSNTIFASGQLLELDRFRHREGGGNRERIDLWVLTPWSSTSSGWPNWMIKQISGFICPHEHSADT